MWGDGLFTIKVFFYFFFNMDASSLIWINNLPR